MELNHQKLTKNEFKQKLIDILNEQLTTYDHDWLIEHMLIYIGDIDSYLRDDLIYTQFCKMISSQALNVNQLNHLFDTIVSPEFLFCNIQEVQTDFVFRRSFSALVLAEILKSHNKFNILEPSQLNDAVLIAVNYMNIEKDERGCVPIKGWAHATAHGADVLRCLAENPKLTHSQNEMIINSVMHKLHHLKEACQANEEKRLAFVYVMMIEKNVDTKLIEDALEKLTKNIEKMSIPKKQNIKSFLSRLRENLSMKKGHQKMIERIDFQIRQIEYVS